jgi:hypothetical protein
LAAGVKGAVLAIWAAVFMLGFQILGF